jgi:23S rRNA pseudouridine2605 synthase
MAKSGPHGNKGRGPAKGARPRGESRANRPPHHEPAPRDDAPHEERLQKVLAHAGIGSRRACEEVILQGRVTVDGKVVRELGTKVDPRRCQVAVDGQKIHLERMVYYAVNKPKGYVSTNQDPSGRPRVVDLLPEIPQRVYTVGRLDEMSMGLMLLTNDGELANRLAHPKYGVEKLYRAVVAGEPPREVLNKLTEGLWLADGKVRAKHVRAVGKKGDATILEIVLAEGKNREVRRMLAKLGHKVMALTRVAVGPIHVKGLAAGAYRPLTAHEVELLRKVADGIAVAPRRRTEQRARPSGRGRAPQGGPKRAHDNRPQGPRRSHENRPQGPRRAHENHAQGPRPPRIIPIDEAGGPAVRRPSSSAGRPGGAKRGTQHQGGPGAQAPRRPMPPPPEGPRRRVIGLAPESEQERPRRPRPKAAAPKRQPPRAPLGPKRRPKPDDETQT